MIQFMKINLLRVAILVCLLISTNLQRAVAEHISAVVELFTSQGCSSCPPADALMQELAKRDDLVVLSYSVDYWDYLGWKDTFASPENTLRQRLYAKSRGEQSVYTPQAVINGTSHTVGSDKPEIETLISNYNELPVDVNLTMKNDAIEVQIDGELPPDAKNTTIYFASVLREATVPIKRGENSNREITYTNIVQELRPIGMWDGASHKVMFPVSEIYKNGADTCAILVQIENEGLPGQILGATLYK